MNKTIVEYLNTGLELGCNDSVIPLIDYLGNAGYVIVYNEQGLVRTIKKAGLPL